MQACHQPDLLPGTPSPPVISACRAWSGALASLMKMSSQVRKAHKSLFHLGHHRIPLLSSTHDSQINQCHKYKDARCAWFFQRDRLMSGSLLRPPGRNLSYKSECLGFPCSCGQSKLSLASVWGALRGGTFTFNFSGGKRKYAGTHYGREGCSCPLSLCQLDTPHDLNEEAKACPPNQLLPCLTRFTIGQTKMFSCALLKHSIESSFW